MSIYRRDTKNKPTWKDEYQTAPEVSFISKGLMTLKIPMTVFSENRNRLIQELKKTRPHSLVIIQAVGPEGLIDQKDSLFFWAFGYYRTPAIGAIDIVSSKSYLIISRDVMLSCERRLNRKEVKNQCLVDNVCYLDELERFLDLMKKYNGCREILIMHHQKQGMPACVLKYDIDYNILDTVFNELVALKTESEIKIIQYIGINLQSALIHIMQRFRPGLTNKQLEAWFSFFMTYKTGFDQLMFSIVPGSDYADYICQDKHLRVAKRQRVFKEGEVCVIEAGASYFGYTLFLGITIPVSETFNRYQKIVYQAVFRMRTTLYMSLKVGRPIDYIQKTAEKILIQNLIEEKVLCGTVQGAYNHGIGKLLIPFDVIHSMKDCSEDSDASGKLELGKMYVFQPGCYLMKRWMDQAYDHRVFKRYLTPELRDCQDVVVKVSDPIIITLNGFRFVIEIPKALDTINEMRSKDNFNRIDFTISLENKNLSVRPSSFHM